MKKFIVRIILPDGKNKTVVDEVVEADHYNKDENNNLAFYDDNFQFVIEYHNYNWISVKPES